MAANHLPTQMPHRAVPHVPAAARCTHPRVYLLAVVTTRNTRQSVPWLCSTPHQVHAHLQVAPVIVLAVVCLVGVVSNALDNGEDDGHQGQQEEDLEKAAEREGHDEGGRKAKAKAAEGGEHGSVHGRSDDNRGSDDGGGRRANHGVGASCNKQAGRWHTRGRGARMLSIWTSRARRCCPLCAGERVCLAFGLQEQEGADQLIQMRN